MHNETLTVSTDHSTHATVTLSFTVRAAPETYTIDGEVTGANGDTVELSLWQGRTQIGSTVELETNGPDVPATYTFENVPAGEYNVVSFLW